MKIEYPKMIYNNDNIAVTVQSEEDHEPLKPFFTGKWDSTKGFSEISYPKALECLGEAKAESEQEIAVRIEKENKDKDEKDTEKLRLEKAGLDAVQKEKNRISLQAQIKNLSSYGWNEIRTLGKQIELELGVVLPLRAKRDVIEKAITEALGNDDSK